MKSAGSARMLLDETNSKKGSQAADACICTTTNNAKNKKPVAKSYRFFTTGRHSPGSCQVQRGKAFYKPIPKA